MTREISREYEPINAFVKAKQHSEMQVTGQQYKATVPSFNTHKHSNATISQTVVAAIDGQSPALLEIPYAMDMMIYLLPWIAQVVAHQSDYKRKETGRMDAILNVPRCYSVTCSSTGCRVRVQRTLA